ncbi:unnamed protein product [Caenorhabditis sp. 36 PRJEB53466]|nr:unnamed protein product [Caenorhabditis sp. 36 PRJEB53466]
MIQLAKSIPLLFRAPKKKTPEPDYETLLLVPDTNVRLEIEIEDELYFHGFMKTDEAEEILQECESGVYLLRTVMTFDGVGYVISAKAESGNVFHMIINKTKETKLYWLDAHAFVSIQQLMGFYAESLIPVRVDEDEQEHEVVFRKPLPRLQWQLAHEQLEMNETLGAGTFGDVFKGFLEVSFRKGRKIVAIKTLKNVELASQKTFELLHEAHHMKRFDHKHVVKFHGLAAFREPFMIAIEFCAGNNLDGRLQKTYIPVFQKIKYLYHASLGINYLHDIGICHGDVATRNCLISADDVIKISDFGLSADKKTKQKKSDNMPLRTMAPECRNAAIFCTKGSDVWAFSGLIFEMFHRAMEPYGEYEPRGKVVEALNNGDIHLYLFERPQTEEPPWGMTLTKKKVWEQTLEKPKYPAIVKEIEILFRQCRFRNLKFRAVFPEEDDPHRRSICKHLENMTKKYNITV